MLSAVKPARAIWIAAFLAELAIDSISVNPASLPRTLTVVKEAEQRLSRVGSAA